MGTDRQTEVDKDDMNIAAATGREFDPTNNDRAGAGGIPGDTPGSPGGTLGTPGSRREQDA